MPGDDLIVIGNQHRIAETEALDRRSDLLDLSLAMTPRVTRVGLKRSDRNVFDRGSEFSHNRHPKIACSEWSKTGDAAICIKGSLVGVDRVGDVHFFASN